MIKSLKVEGLNEKSGFDLELEFNDDLNILTGKNGSGKTTILKLIWYINGAYFDQLISELTFKQVELITDKAKTLIKKEESVKEKVNFYKIFFNDKPINLYEDGPRAEYRSPRLAIYRKEIIPFLESTVFFPTFRRIEGGFSIQNERGPIRINRNNLKEALSELSENLSFSNQKFIASISTDDLVQLLTSEFANITERINTLQKKQSDRIIDKIKFRKPESDANQILDSIQKDIEQTELLRQENYRPFTVLAELIAKIFQYKGISLSRFLTIGEIGDAIASDKLSAGEKQMLSFLCYNTFTKNSSIFIDEPELSLHPDWQRTLVPVLLEQGNNNQFFMATHSPFIYSKYPDKEIMVGQDKGDF